ncbi:MAG: nucleotidyltransferase family protein [Gemmatimonadaceae bacterium]|nr:nucleotidyltransferase family protein [Gemmatimonadaceae bacterium]NUQ94779.1 nucleotidyltransferase family protein [Gemmatimonadaceae bacterium]NUR34013.1 nucleotidyltransferase family protein [Gemmatimonadaceae bacterium]
MDTPDPVALTHILLGYLSRADAPPPPTLAAWDALADEAEAQEVDAAMYVVATRRGEVLPHHLEQRLALAAALNGVRNARRRVELRAILEAFGAAGVDAIVLKGMHLAHLVYPDPSMRLMSDIDILVREASLARAADVMRALGYRQDREETLERTLAAAHHLPAFRREEASPVEIHWTISRPPSPFDVDLAGLWERSRAAMIGDVPARVLCDADLIQHLCLHLAYNHAWVLREQREAPLRALLDLVVSLERLAPEIDWKQSIERANRLGTGRFVYCALAVVGRMAERPLDDVLAGLARETGDDAIVEAACALVSGRETGVMHESLARVAAMPRTSRARGALGALFPSRESMRRRYGLAGAADVTPWHYLRRLAGFVAGGRWLAAFTVRGRGDVEQLRRRTTIKSWKRRTLGRS